AGAAHQNVDLAEMAFRFLRRAFDRRRIGDIDRDAVSLRAEPGGGLVDLGGVDVPDADAAALGDDAPGAGEADAGGTAGDDGAAAGITVAEGHGHVPLKSDQN